MSDPLTLVYEAQTKLKAASSSADAIAKETASYEHLINSVKGTDPVKSLCADFIPEFLHFFPSLAERALNAQLDLCEDEKLAIRSRAVRGLEQICKNSPVYVQRVADVLGQLLAAEDPHEIQTVKQTFSAIFALDAKAAFQALFNQIKEAGADANLREKGIEFLDSQLSKHDKLIKATDDLQSAILAGVASVLSLELPAKKFGLFLRYLLSFKSFREDPEKASKISAFLAHHAKLSSPFDSSSASVAQLAEGLNSVRFYASKHGVSAEPFFSYFFTKVLPVFKSLADADKVAIAHALSLAIAGVDGKFARTQLPVFWAAMKEYFPQAEANKPAEEKAVELTPALLAAYQVTEAALVIVHRLCEADALAAQSVTGLAPVTGQPSDLVADGKRADFTGRLAALQANVAAWAKATGDALAEVQKALKETKKEDEAAKKALFEKKKALLINRRVAASIPKLIQPLMAKDPKFVKDLKGLDLSYGPKNKEANADNKKQQKDAKGDKKQGDKKAGDKKAGEKGQKKKGGDAAQSQKGAKKGDNKQQGGQKRKSDGDNKQQQNNKKNKGQDNQRQGQQQQQQGSAQKRGRQDNNNQQGSGQKRQRQQSNPRQQGQSQQQGQMALSSNPLIAMAQYQQQMMKAALMSQMAAMTGPGTGFRPRPQQQQQRRQSGGNGGNGQQQRGRNNNGGNSNSNKGGRRR